MDRQSLWFRRLILVEVLVIVSIIPVVAFAAPIPVELEESAKALDSPIWQQGNSLLEPIEIGLLLANILSLFGLWRFKAWARTMYSVTFGLGCLLFMIGPATVSRPIDSFLEIAYNVTTGGLLALMWLSDVRKRFDGIPLSGEFADA